MTKDQMHNAQADVVSIAMDAFRLAMGMKPRRWTARDVIDWLIMMQDRGST